MILPVGTCVRINGDSEYYSDVEYINNPHCIGVIINIHKNTTLMYGVKWINGYENGYEEFGLDVWLGWTVKEESNAKREGTYDRDFYLYASKKGIEIARLNGQYIPNRIITDLTTVNGG